MPPKKAPKKAPKTLSPKQKAWRKVFEEVVKIAKANAKKNGTTYRDEVAKAWKDKKIVEMRKEYDAKWKNK